MSAKQGQVRWLVGVAGAYVLITCVLTFPAVMHWGSAVAGFEGLDSLQYTWSLWWSSQAWQAGHSPAQVSLLYYPWGGEHALLDVTPLLDWLAWPLEQLLTPTQVYNTLYLTSFPLTATAMYLLARGLRLPRVAAFLSGLVWAFFPNRMGHALAGHFTQLASWLFPLVALAYLRLLREPRWRWALATGALIALASLIALVQTAYFLAPFLVLLLLGGLVVYRRQLTARTVLMVAASCSLALALALIKYGPFLWQAVRQGTDLAAAGVTEHSTDFLALVMPSPYHPLWGRLLRSVPMAAQIIPEANDVERLGYLGWSVLALALVALVRRGKSQWLWAAMALLALVFSLGPRLVVGGRVTEMAMPYAWLMRLPFFGWGRTPERFNQLAFFALALLAGGGLAALRLDRTASVALCFVVLVDLMVLWPCPGGTPAPPAYLTSWRGEGGAVLDMPIAKRQIGNLAMYYQTQHDLPIVGGYIHRELPGMRAYVKAIDAAVSEQALTAWRPLSSGELAGLLAGLDVGHVLLHRHFVAAERVAQQEARLSAALGPPADRTEVVIHYAVPTQTLPEQWLAVFGETVELVDVATDPRSVMPGSTIQVSLAWRCLQRPALDYTVFVHLVDDTGVRLAQHDGQPLGGNWPTSNWAPGTWCRDEHPLTVPADARSGSYSLLIGWYDLSSGEKLAVTDGTAAANGGAALVPGVVQIVGEVP
jgi:hypothetical protein